MKLFLNLYNSLEKNKERNAFLINEVFYKYADLAGKVSAIRAAINKSVGKDDGRMGLVANDDIETYAAIIALWFEGKAYVPLSPDVPKVRNESVISQAGLKTIIDSSASPLFPDYHVIESKKVNSGGLDAAPKITEGEEPVYILFTSGTTGQPKGVPITRNNLSGFVDAFWKMGFEIDEHDRVLQMFELTFDLSVMSYLIPLLQGACVYTIPKDKIKYAYINDLMEAHKLTVALMVPSILHYLRPYFAEIDAPHMRYSLFCGEALPLDILVEWGKCVPNAEIVNVYGPTEDTIFCTHYWYSRQENNKSHNGILSIGRAMEGTQIIIIDEDEKTLPFGNTGQLCLGGVQLTPGYWKNEEKNKEAFFITDLEGTKKRFYKTGDLCIVDEQGDILYLGRIDFQTKIQGFRVELSEIEFYAKSFIGKRNVVALGITDAIGNTEIGLVIESAPFDTDSVMDGLKSKLPVYMIPKQIKFIDEFPLNSNGKTDRKKLGLLFNK